MQRIDLGYADDYGVRTDGGRPATFENCVLDYTENASSYAHPAVIPQETITTVTTATGAQIGGATQPPGPGLPTFSTSADVGHSSPAWSAIADTIATAQAGDAVSFSVTALRVVLTLAGILTPGSGVLADPALPTGAIRNGAQATLLVDGAAYASYDLLGQQTDATLYFRDGASHTIAVQHAGTYNAALHPISAVVAGVGASVAASLSLAALSTPTFVAATWRVTATGASTFTLETQRPGSSSWTSVATGLAVGTTYSDSPYVPGVSLVIPGGTTLTSGDSATFTTDVTMVAVVGVSIGTGDGSTGASSLTTPVWSLGSPMAQPVVLEWTQNTPLAAVTVQTGPTPQPDATWNAPVTVPLTSWTTEDGTTEYGMAGLMAVPPGLYGQATLSFAGVSSVAAWIRDIHWYSWDSQTEVLLQRISLGDGGACGPNLLSSIAAHGLFTTDLHEALVALDQGRAVATATDGYLAAALDEVGLLQVTGEPPQAARTRVQSILSTDGLTLPGICRSLTALIFGQAGTPLLFWNGVGYSARGMLADNTTPTGLVVRTTSPTAFSIEVPPIDNGPLPTTGFYPGLPGVPLGDPSAPAPGTARWIIQTHALTELRPVCSVPAVNFH